MASKESARRVARAQASGRGAKVRRQIPVGFYSALTVIVVAGIAVVSYSKYELDHPASAVTAADQPVIGTTWHTAIGFDACGKYLPSLTKTTNVKSGVTSLGNGVLTIAPKAKSQEGANATLALLPDGVPGLKIFKSGFQIPGHKAVTVAAGCGGKPAKFGIYVWSSLLATKPTVYVNPADVRLQNDQIVTVAVLRKGVTPSQPPTAANLATVGATSTAKSTNTSTGTAKSTGTSKSTGAKSSTAKSSTSKK
jgi:hypothetical protein